MIHSWWINSLAPGKSGCDFKNSIFNFVSLTGICRTSYANTLRWMPRDLSNGKSTLVQVMATSHYLSQCWPRSMSPNGIIRPQWVKVINKPILFRVVDCHSASCITLIYGQNWLVPIFNKHTTECKLRDQSVYAPSQWEMALQCNAIYCNAISHRLGAYNDWSLKTMCMSLRVYCFMKTSMSSESD